MSTHQQAFRIFNNAYEKILYSISNLIFVFDEHGNFLEFYCDDLSTLYISPPEFLGKNIEESGLPSDIVKNTKQQIKKVIKTGKEGSFQYSLEFQKETKHFDAHFFLLDTKQVFAIIRDISSIKRSELFHKELKRYYQDILNRMDHGIAETDEKWIIQYANRAFKKMMGIEEVDFEKENFFKIIQRKEEQKKAEQHFEKQKKRKKFYTIESRFSIKNQERILKINIAKSNCNISKKILHNIYIDDVTEERNKREILEKKEQTYRSLVETSPTGILIRDKKKILFANATAIKILGFKNLAEATNFSLENLYLPEYYELIKERLESASAGKEVPYMEVKIKRPSDNQIVEIETIPVKIYYEGKEAYQIVIKDVSIEKKFLETKLRADIAEESYMKLREEIVVRQEVEHKLSRSLEEKNLLLKEVHHRVKNNLQIISSILNLEIRSQSNQDVGQALKRIQNRISSIYLIHEIVYQTDMFSRVDLGQYIKTISETMIRSSAFPDMKFFFKLDNVYVTLDIGVPIGMILNELFYSFFENILEFDLKKQLLIDLKYKNNLIELKITYPKRLILEKNKKSPEATLSAQLIDALADQINGTYIIKNEIQKNEVFILSF